MALWLGSEIARREETKKFDAFRFLFVRHTFECHCQTLNFVDTVSPIRTLNLEAVLISLVRERL